jgi:hypothetical protein
MLLETVFPRSALGLSKVEIMYQEGNTFERSVLSPGSNQSGSFSSGYGCLRIRKEILQRGTAFAIFNIEH